MSGKDGPKENRQERTIFKPAPTGAPSMAPASTPFPAGPPQPLARPIQVGDVLNHMYQVRRFIDRGGMGEVFEGINVASGDERVAIKVILPHLAANPDVQAMFRKEARTLTRLNHPALVQYRGLAQEPQLGVFYIVTEFIDGQNLSNVLATLRPTPQQMIALTRRLAEGLEAAHGLGAIHRDMSPDNVLLEGGRLEDAKIIDFGIAKDLDPGSATIVGGGFAGKLNYVAPEQLGDYDREIGPWTDVYSLGLVILAVARERELEFGRNLVDAIDKRRANLDLAAVPEVLRPVLLEMLAPNPANRLRSMRDVLDRLGPYGPASPPTRATPSRPTAPKLKDAATVGGWIRTHLPLVAGGGAALVVLLAAGIHFATRGVNKPPPVAKAVVATAKEAPRNGTDPVVAARTVLDAGLTGIGCSWLEVVNVAGTPDGVAIVLRGVAGKPAEAQGQVARLLMAGGVKVAGINFEGVSPISTSECAPIEGFRRVRNLTGGRLAVAQRQFEMTTLGADAGTNAGKVGATAIIDVALDSGVPDAALFGVEESGAISAILPDRAAITTNLQQVAEGKYRLELITTHKGWSGILLLTGKGPFAPDRISGPAGSHGAAWQQTLATLARERGWKSEMVWYKTVDEQPN